MKFTIIMSCICGNRRSYDLHSSNSMLSVLDFNNSINDDMFHTTSDDEGVDIYCKKCCRHVDII
jgi:hypothetical protein